MHKHAPSPLLTKEELRDTTARIMAYLETPIGKRNAYNAYRLWPTEESALIAIVMHATQIRIYERLQQIVERLNRLHGPVLRERFGFAKTHQFVQNTRLE